MSTFQLYRDPLAPDDLLHLPMLKIESSVWETFELDYGHHDSALKAFAIVEEKLQSLKTNHFHLDTNDTPLPDLESSNVSTAASDDGSALGGQEEHEEAVEKDVWRLPEISEIKHTNALLSWDVFHDPTVNRPRTTYLSEKGAEAFDAVLAQSLKQALPARVARPDKFVYALSELSIGRQSGLFNWNEARAGFELTSQDFHISGISLEVQHQIVTVFIDIGNDMRYLQDYTRSGAGAKTQSPIHAALAASISNIVHGISSTIGETHTANRSIAQLQQKMQRPGPLCRAMCKLIDFVKAAGPGLETFPELINQAQMLSDQEPWLEQIMSSVVSSIARPLLLQMHQDTALGCPRTRSTDYTDSTLNYADIVSSLLSQDQGQIISECRDALRLVQMHDPDHPILRSSVHTTSIPLPSWQDSWEALHQLQQKVDQYERNLKEAVVLYAKDLHTEDFVNEPSLQVKTPAVESPQPAAIHPWELDLDLEYDSSCPSEFLPCAETNHLSRCVMKCLRQDSSQLPPFRPRLTESLSLSVAPFLLAQHRLLSSSVLHILFKHHEFVSHLQLQHRFHLLTDGAFASRLTDALFDSDQASAQGRRKEEGTTGLRLQSRDTWPPASSELRLVLMGVLNESLSSDAHVRNGRTSSSDVLADSISFAIRDLTDQELENCRDVDSVHALDFLRLQYKPPSELLEAVLTPTSMKKYDRIFKFLLRLLRVKKVALDLVREVSGRRCKVQRRKDTRFRNQINHFVSTLAEYSTNVAIGAAWARFEAVVVPVDNALGQYDFEEAVRIAGSLEKLKEQHEEMLDDILRALCRTRKQTQVQSLLDEVFGLILKFAALARNADMIDDFDTRAKAMHEEFRKLGGMLIQYLESQCGMFAVFGDASSKDAAVFEQLLVRLDLFGYYS